MCCAGFRSSQRIQVFVNPEPGPRQNNKTTFCPFLRSVTLKNGYNEYENGVMALLVHLEIRKIDLGESYLKKMINNFLTQRKSGKSSVINPVLHWKCANQVKM